MESSFIVRILGDDSRTEEELRKLLTSDTIDDSELIVRRFDDDSELMSLIQEFSEENKKSS